MAPHPQALCVRPGPVLHHEEREPPVLFRSRPRCCPLASFSSHAGQRFAAVCIPTCRLCAVQIAPASINSPLPPSLSPPLVCSPTAAPTASWASPGSSARRSPPPPLTALLSRPPLSSKSCRPLRPLCWWVGVEAAAAAGLRLVAVQLSWGCSCWGWGSTCGSSPSVGGARKGRGCDGSYPAARAARQFAGRLCGGQPAAGVCGAAAGPR